MSDTNIIIWAFLGGFLPALLWLWFWLKEDTKHPEPKRLIFVAFLAGIAAVPVALVLERMAAVFITNTFVLLSSWSTIEEILKYAGAYIVAFRGVCLDRSICLDEPIDPLIYMITVALGFAALENMLFLLGPLNASDAAASLITGNLRFIGATILHTVASASVGIAMGLSFYKSDIRKRIYLAIGLFTAVVLHALFNFSILISGGENIFLVFGVIWILVIGVLLFFEKIKTFRKKI